MAVSEPLLEGLTGTPTRREPDRLEKPGVRTSETGEFRGTAFEGDERAADKQALIKYLVYHPEGVPLSKWVRDVLTVGGEGSARGEGGDRPDEEPDEASQWAFARRFAESSDLVDVDTDQPQITARPTLQAFNLNAVKQNSKTSEEGLYPRDFAAGLVDRVDKAGRAMPDVTRTLVDQYTTYLESIEDRYCILEHTREPEKYLLLPYRTRFNDEGRINDQWRRYHQAWKRAEENYESAVSVTLTTDPKKFDSLKEMKDGLQDNFERLMSWLEYDPENGPERPGFRPDYIKALEWTPRAGYPHLHVIFFGVSWLVHQEALSNYWDKRQGQIVHIKRVSKRDGEFLLHDVDEEGETVKKSAAGYIGKYMSKNFEALETRSDGIDLDDGEQVQEVFHSAMYWATNSRMWTASQSLTGESQEEEDGDGIDLTEWRFVGAAAIEDIPYQVYQNARILGIDTLKPPPG